MCCGQWVSFPSPAQIATLPPRSLQLQLMAKCPRSALGKQSDEEVCREDLDGEIGPREGSKLESKKETANFLVGRN